MTTYNDREKSFEKKFVMDEEAKFKAESRRNRLLGQWAETKDLRWLLTAHHADDQAETLAMRLARGSGLSGLSGIRDMADIAGVRVARPLLGWRRAELAEIVAAAGIEPVADPSNEDERFDRVRMRKRLAGAGWLDPIAVARSAAALAQADDALDWAVDRLLKERAREEQGAVLFDPSGIPAELRRRIARTTISIPREPA